MEKRTHKSNLPAIAFALAALTAALPLSAMARDESPTENVPYGDLNLATEAGVETLDRRLDRAVERVCGVAAPRSLGVNRIIEECKDEAWQRIQGARQVAIAQATGNTNGLAENSPRGHVQVSFAE